MRLLCLAIAFAVALIAGPNPRALAEEDEAISLLSLEISGDAPPELRQQVRVHIAQGLAKGRNVLGLEDTHKALAASPELIGCFSSECLVRIGDALGVRRFVRAVLVASGAHYELKLELLEIGQSELLQNSITTSCSICTIEDLNERSAEAAGRLLILDAPKLMGVTIASIPDGALISIDGLEAGTGPVETELQPGQHRVSATKEGYATSAKTINVLAAATAAGQRFELPLVKPLIDARPVAPNYGYWKWGSMAVSGSLLIVGTALVVIDDNPTCGSETRQCEFKRNTMLGGVLSLTGSLLAGAATGWMFWDESQGKRNTSPLVQLVPGGASAGLAVEF